MKDNYQIALLSGLISGIIGFTFIYVIGAFVSLEFNFFQWSKLARAGLIVPPVILCVACTLSHYNPEEEGTTVKDNLSGYQPAQEPQQKRRPPVTPAPPSTSPPPKNP